MEQENKGSIAGVEPQPPIKKQNFIKYISIALGVLLVGASVWFGAQYINSGTATLVMDSGWEGGRVTKDTKYVYLGGVRVGNPVLDAQTFEYIEGISPGGYDLFRDKNGVYNLVTEYRDDVPSGTDRREVSFKELEGADPATFTVTHNGFIATDKNHVYVRGELIPDSSSQNFRVLAMLRPYEEPAYPGYFIAGNKLYSINDPTSPREVDLASFKVVSASDFIFKDKNGVYYRLQKIEKVDEISLKVQKSWDDLGRGFTYIISNAAVYVMKVKELEEISNADASTFAVVRYSYAKDKNHVYLGTAVIEGENPSSFTNSRAFELTFKLSR